MFSLFINNIFLLIKTVFFLLEKNIYVLKKKTQLQLLTSTPIGGVGEIMEEQLFFISQMSRLFWRCQLGFL